MANTELLQLRGKPTLAQLFAVTIRGLLIIASCCGQSRLRKEIEIPVEKTERDTLALTLLLSDEENRLVRPWRKLIWEVDEEGRITAFKITPP